MTNITKLGDGYYLLDFSELRKGFLTSDLLEVKKYALNELLSDRLTVDQYDQLFIN